jgi:predicted transcriptional regulator
MEDVAKRSMIRIIEILTEQDKITISDLARKSKLGYEPTDNNIRDLSKLGLVKDYYVGKNRFIEPKFRTLKLIFEKHGKAQTQIM